MRLAFCVFTLLLLVSFPLFASSNPTPPPLDPRLASKFYQLWESSGFGQNPDRIERAAWFVKVKSGNYGWIKWSSSGNRNGDSWRGAVPEGTVAQAHTHPANLDPRQLSVTFKPDQDNPGRTIFTVDPQLNLTSFYNKVPYGNTDASYDNKTYTWSVTASSAKPQIEPYDYIVSTSAFYTQWGTAVKVVNGTLTLSDGTLAVTVPQGQCLLDSMASNTGSLVQQYTSAACP